MSEREWVSVTETAKLIRWALGREFPRTKFSVRSSKYAGGASIDVAWTDGPTSSQVERITGPFSGKGFDGMVDLGYSKQSWLEEDGTATFAHHEGTNGSVSERFGSRRTAGARLVHFGADYVFTHREFSPEFLARREARVASRRCHDAHGGQCGACGNWGVTDGYVVDIEHGTRFVCSVQCGARLAARRVAAVR